MYSTQSSLTQFQIDSFKNVYFESQGQTFNSLSSYYPKAYVSCVMLMQQKIEKDSLPFTPPHPSCEAFPIGFNGVYFDDRFLDFVFRSPALASWLTSSVMTLKPRASSNETTRGGGDRPPSIEECLSLMVLVTSARLLADKTDNEVGGRPRVTLGCCCCMPLPSAEDMEEMEPLELCNEFRGGRMWPVGIKHKCSLFRRVLCYLDPQDVICIS